MIKNKIMALMCVTILLLFLCSCSNNSLSDSISNTLNPEWIIEQQRDKGLMDTAVSLCDINEDGNPELLLSNNMDIEKYFVYDTNEGSFIGEFLGMSPDNIYEDVFTQYGICENYPDNECSYVLRKFSNGQNDYIFSDYFYYDSGYAKAISNINITDNKLSQNFIFTESFDPTLVYDKDISEKILQDYSGLDDEKYTYLSTLSDDDLAKYCTIYVYKNKSLTKDKYLKEINDTFKGYKESKLKFITCKENGQVKRFFEDDDKDNQVDELYKTIENLFVEWRE